MLAQIRFRTYPRNRTKRDALRQPKKITNVDSVIQANIQKIAIKQFANNWWLNETRIISPLVCRKHNNPK